MKKIVILGSTGSIGTGTLDVVRRDPGAFRVLGLGAGENTGLLQRQIEEFGPARAAVAGERQARSLRARLGGKVDLLWGDRGLEELAADEEADLVVVAIPGTKALLPAFGAIRRGKDIALASKEILVAAGELALAEAAVSGSRILPVDSEHSAVFQCLRGERRESVRKIILTASGGPFLNASRAELEKATAAQALRHPRWKMGRKVTLDSATLMNKGLEVLEARWLFGLPLDRIDIVIHPQSIVHSLVEMCDGSLLAQMSRPDMRLPISYALYYPDRSPRVFQATALPVLEPLTFFEPDRETFPALDLAVRAGAAGGTMPAAMNAANEAAGAAFLKNEIPFLGIMEVVESVMDDHQVVFSPDLPAILAADRWARRRAEELIRVYRRRSQVL
ncbi:MAG: 1-deoxy-D-xylulose-5-phosphate reductoisomerase [PVC group bacterium]